MLIGIKVSKYSRLELKMIKFRQLQIKCLNVKSDNV
jgi:hypothetical protein